MMPEEFWQLTNHEILVWLEARGEKVADLAMMTAWNTANFQRASKMPDLEKVLPSKQAKKTAKDPETLARELRDKFKQIAGAG